MATAGRSKPRLILSGYQPEDEGAPLPMDWQARFGNRSPLARKVITFNLVALGVLVSGVLYLNQFQDGLFAVRERGMRAEGMLIVAAIEEDLGVAPSSAGDWTPAIRRVQALSANTQNGLRLYDLNGRFVGGSAGAPLAGDRDPVVAEPRQTSAFISIVGELWDRIARLYADNTRRAPAPLSSSIAASVARVAVARNDVVSQQTTSNQGELVLIVGVPLRIGETVVGALALSTPPGEIDVFVRGEREQILQVFALAIMCSILLSLVLANTIVRPLRYLAEAAQEGGATNRRKDVPKRVDIPDLTGRPDEIGYLSGAMQAMTEALYDRIEANEMFAADVAHEIKNPLTSLRSAVETMPYAKDDAGRKRLLDVIKQDVDRLNRLVTDISNASRLDSELVRDTMTVFDLHKLLRDLIEYNQSGAAQTGARLEVRFGDAPLQITGLEGRLAQVFVNLITNAISFSKAGDRITLDTEQVGRTMVRIKVEDTGPGIPDNNLRDIFKRFYSERPTQDFGNNSGLGLAISKQIVEAHGGRIWAENIRPAGKGREVAPDGARFIVELPV